jgi:hypothetical protein
MEIMMNEDRTFGQYMKELRSASRQGLREFCSHNSFDPGNVSKIERGVFPPPQDDTKLAQYATALQLKRGTAEWKLFFDLAALENGRLPIDIASDKELVKKLPLLCRTIKNKALSADKLERLIELINEE